MFCGFSCQFYFKKHTAKRINYYSEEIMPIKAVIWDIGGVIMRTEDPAPRGELAAALGVTRAFLNELVFGGEQGTRAQRGEISQQEMWEYVRSELRLASGTYPDLRERFFGGDVLDTELVDFIRSIQPNYQIGIISNAWSQIADSLKEWGIQDAFDMVVGSGDVGIMKPDPRIYQIALERLNVAAEEAVFVDDFIENVHGAQAQGMHAIHFRSREQAIQELKDLLDL
jgi:epoxide hydrolase-like predicted phosphatase